jgi:hypothetical protein
LVGVFVAVLGVLAGVLGVLVGVLGVENTHLTDVISRPPPPCTPRVCMSISL